jgi:hypothetical protein
MHPVRRTNKHLSELKAIQELEAELARAEERIREIERIEEQLLVGVPLVGFRTASEERNLRTEREMLAEAIRKNRQLLSVARR